MTGQWPLFCVFFRKFLRSMLFMPALVLLSSEALLAENNKADEQPAVEWFGFLTSENYPAQACKIVAFKVMNERRWFDMDSSAEYYSFFMQMEEQIKDYFSKQGWHGVLSYRTHFHGGAGRIVTTRDGLDVNQVLLSGVTTFDGL